MQLKEELFIVKSNPSDFVVYGYLHRHLNMLYNKMNYSKANDDKVQERIEEKNNNKLLTTMFSWIITLTMYNIWVRIVCKKRIVTTIMKDKRKNKRE